MHVHGIETRSQEEEEISIMCHSNGSRGSKSCFFLACSQKVKFIEKASNENVIAETEFWKLALDWKEIQELNKQEDFFGQHLVALVWSLSFFSCYFSPALLKNKASNFITTRNSGLHDSLSIKRL